MQPGRMYVIVRDSGGGSRALRFNLSPTLAGGSAEGKIFVQRGSTVLAVTSVVLSGLVMGVGYSVANSGDTRNCGYGDSGSNGYTATASGPCSTATPPAGYEQESTHDSGFTAEQNRNIGYAVTLSGGAALATSLVWWLWSRSDDKMSWDLEAPEPKTAQREGTWRLGLGTLEGKF